MQIKDLIRYNLFVRELYFDAIAKLPWVAVVEPRGLSFDSMRDVFLHLTVVEDRWIGFVILGSKKEWVGLDFDAFNDFDAFEKMHAADNGKHGKLFRKLSDEELKREVVVPFGDKQKISVETVLTHIVIEDMIHYGELSAAFWQMGLQAPYMAFGNINISTLRLTRKDRR